jgi:hypothetical protein
MERDMDPYRLLHIDHENVSALFAKLEATTTRAGKSRESLFKRLREELELHTKLEENIFYPALKEAAATHEIILEAFEEHAVVKILLKELNSLATNDERWLPKLRVLKENVEHHVKEEEGQMFKKARTVLDKETADWLGDEMKKAKEQKPEDKSFFQKVLGQ